MKKGQKKGDYFGVKLSNSNGNSTLNADVLANVKEMIADKKTDKEIYETLGIPRRTWETWKSTNYLGFKTFVVDSRHEIMLQDSIQEIAKLQHDSDVKIRLEANKYVSERLGKQWYSTRQENRVIEQVETLDETEQERLNKLLTQQNKESPYTEKAL